MSMPSTMNGRRTKPFVAPTDFIMLISVRRENIVTLTVLEMMNRETMARMTMIARLATRTIISMFESFVAMSL